MSELSYQEALEYAGLCSQCSSCAHRFLSADQEPCVCCAVINPGARVEYFKSILDEREENGECPEDLTVEELKQWKHRIERTIVANIESYTSRTGDFPEIKVERILVINEGRRSFKYEVKIK